MSDWPPPRVLAVWCPDWPVHAVGAGPDVPAAVLVGQGARRTVLACSAAARAEGVRRGQRVRDAQRVCPRLRVYQRDEMGEERSFEPVVRAVEDVVAGVEVVRPGLIVLDARGPARYHGGEARLALLIREAVADVGMSGGLEQGGGAHGGGSYGGRGGGGGYGGGGGGYGSGGHGGYSGGVLGGGGLGTDSGGLGADGVLGIGGEPLGCGVGVADGAFAAGLAARRPVDEPLIVPPGAGPAFLAPYPLRVLERPDLAGILERLGVRTLGGLAALPAADVANRFGPIGVRAHRLARGLDPRPPAARRPGEDLSARYVFDPPAERDEPVVFAAKALADRWHAALGAAGATCATVRIELSTESGRECVRGWRNGDALGSTLSAQALAQRVRWQLEGWRVREARRLSAADAASARSQGSVANATANASADDVDGTAAADLAAADLAVDPVVCLRLVPGPLVIDTGSQQTLWGREEVPDRVGRVAERVQAMLGHDGVLQLHPTGGRDPTARIGRALWGEQPPLDRSGSDADRALAPRAGTSGANPTNPGGPADPADPTESTVDPAESASKNPVAPWPGAVPDPAPALVPDEPYPAALLDPASRVVGVTGRAGLTGRPAVLVLDGVRLPIIGWAGPWPYHERPWRPAESRRRARLQVATADGRAFLLALEHGEWRVEGVYQ